MLRYILKRLVISVLTVFVLAATVFVLMHALPGDAFDGEKATAQVRANLEKTYGFDKPLHIQFFKYIGNLVRGDFGISMKHQGQRVNDLIAVTFPISADLGIRALLFAIILGLFLGVCAAQLYRHPLRHGVMIIAIIGISVPDFIMGSILQYIFAYKGRLFPVAGWGEMKYTVLPAFALSFYTMALLSRFMRTSMLTVINEDYIKTARAKGLPRYKIVLRHQIRNAMLPIITILGPIVAAVLTGTFVIERIFNIPGMGKFYVNAISDRDYTLTLGMTVFYGIFLIGANFIVDVLYSIIDPRIRISGERDV
ncbi:ABC transporter permease [bacterium]|nr:ABC transporter permease [bacterium]